MCLPLLFWLFWQAHHCHFPLSYPYPSLHSFLSNSSSFIMEISPACRFLLETCHFCWASIFAPMTIDSQDPKHIGPYLIYSESFSLVCNPFMNVSNNPSWWFFDYRVFYRVWMNSKVYLPTAALFPIIFWFSFSHLCRNYSAVIWLYKVCRLLLSQYWDN